MPRDKAIRYVVAWLALAMLGEVYVVGLAWASHAGLLGGAGGTGPVSVLVVEESSERDKLTEGQLEIIASHSPGSFLDWIKTHGEKGRGGAYRVVDKDDSMGQDESWKTAFALVVKESRDGNKLLVPSMPWLVVTRGGRVLLSEALPKEESETMRHLKRLGGN